MPWSLDSLYESHDIIGWLNETLDKVEPSNLATTEQHVGRLLGAIDIACQDNAAEIECLIDQISNGVPRLAYDLHYMRDGALSLQSALSIVQKNTKAAASESTDAALDNLQRLHLVKARMEATKSVLQEAESWNSLEVEVMSFLTENNYEKAAERLSEANKSMVVFANTQEFDSRRSLMVSLQNQLEAALSSALVAAIAAQESGRCRQIYSIFSNIQRENEFRSYYNASTRANLVAMWNEATIIENGHLALNNTQTGGIAFASFLPTFYATFLALLHQERVSIAAIFPDPAPTMSSLMSSVLSSMQPSFSQCLSSVSAHHGAATILSLVTAFKATEEFALAAEKVLEKLQYASETSGQKDLSSQKSSHRRRSSRMSISLRPTTNHSLVNNSITDAGESDWDHDLFEPFSNYQNEYASLERRFLDSALDRIFSSDSTDYTHDWARSLRERSLDIFSEAESSIARCMNFTHGYGAVGLIQTLDYFFKSFIDVWTANVTSSRLSTSNTLSFTLEEDLSDLDYTAQDWSSIQLSFHLLASIRAFLDRLTTFETHIWSNLGQLSMRFRLASDPQSGIFVVGTSRGAGQLLIQSPLNSLELHNLLKDSEGRMQGRANLLSPLCLASRSSISAFAATSQESLQAIILAPLKKHLSAYASSPQWIAGPPARSRALDVPTFSLAPSDIAQRLAEGMLNLPRIFEVYAGDDALSFSLETLPFIEADPLRPRIAISTGPDRSPTSNHARRPSLVHKVSSQSQLEMKMTPEAISTAWLTSLTRSICSHLTTKILPDIKYLSVHGASQLSSDIDYLLNIASALGAEWPELRLWRDYVTMDESEANERSIDASDRIFKQVAEIRGWAQS